MCSEQSPGFSSYFLLLFHKVAIVTEIDFLLSSPLIFQDGLGNLPCGKRERKGNYTPKPR